MAADKTKDTKNPTWTTVGEMLAKLASIDPAKYDFSGMPIPPGAKKLGTLPQELRQLYAAKMMTAERMARLKQELQDLDRVMGAIDTLYTTGVTQAFPPEVTAKEMPGGVRVEGGQKYGFGPNWTVYGAPIEAKKEKCAFCGGNHKTPFAALGIEGFPFGAMGEGDEDGEDFLETLVAGIADADGTDRPSPLAEILKRARRGGSAGGPTSIFDILEKLSGERRPGHPSGLGLHVMGLGRRHPSGGFSGRT